MAVYHEQGMPHYRLQRSTVGKEDKEMIAIRNAGRRELEHCNRWRVLRGNLKGQPV
eukprot:CAMPEP_0174344824 /NCGR_PEP_ID=MMETSP0811_2-20130205/135_1 /TAXON_ID=73025 ORGANISM="Eutreptiella gymnastica-like, Strain CCMP1594" /NCGR_SAMPLE_ID=MMETSP0811_2 /ASSEMBLY_ACC=CAM_ASM_000667 /LENGTH=55 /DNA_ID=CAMNT_0015468081 /DNA_START=1366 /DNA_END=1530 /DNA_ORIENTATION=-